jgi:DNA polymerase III alpha subunit
MKTYANDIKENDQVDSLFLVKEKSSGVTKTGNAYLKLKLVDRSGEIEGRIWSLAETFSESFEKDDFVHVMGKVKDISSLSTFTRQDQTCGKVMRFTLFDETGEIKLVAWRDLSRLIDDILPGEKLKCKWSYPSIIRN